MIRSFLYAEHLRSVSHVAVLNSPQGGSLRTDVRQGLLKEISGHGVGFIELPSSPARSSLLTHCFIIASIGLI